MNEYKLRLVRTRTIYEEQIVTVRAHSEQEAKSEYIEDEDWEEFDTSDGGTEVEIQGVEEDSLPSEEDAGECDCEDCIAVLNEHRFGWQECPKCKILSCPGHINSVTPCDVQVCESYNTDGDCDTDHTRLEEDFLAETKKNREALGIEPKPNAKTKPKSDSDPWWEQ